MIQSIVMDLQRAISDLAEVRGRLAHVQRFEGYSAPAAALSGFCAIAAGLVQLQPSLAANAAMSRMYLSSG